MYGLKWVSITGETGMGEPAFESREEAQEVADICNMKWPAFLFHEVYYSPTALNCRQIADSTRDDDGQTTVRLPSEDWKQIMYLLYNIDFERYPEQHDAFERLAAQVEGVTE